jgi:hypothetical protein
MQPSKNTSGLFEHASNGYIPLFLNLEGYWDHSLAELPSDLREIAEERFFPFCWDDLNAMQRRSVAVQIDYHDDPAHEPSLYFGLARLADDLKVWIEKARRDSKDAVVVVLRDVADRVETILATDRDRVGADIQRLRKASNESAPRETTYLNIIGGLLDLLVSGARCGNQTAIIATLLERHRHKPGLSQRTLEEKFAAAKRSLSAT